MENRYTDHKVDNGKMYYYVVSAVNAVGEGAYSEEAKAYPQVGSCRYWPFDEAGGCMERRRGTVGEQFPF